jgi:hypothetical protein
LDWLSAGLSAKTVPAETGLNTAPAEENKTMKITTSDAAVLAVRYEARIWREAFTGTQEVRNEVTGVWEDKPTHHPASWAVYDVESGVQLDYSKDEDDARKTAAKWNAGKIPTAIEAKAESARDLKKLLKPGDTVKTILRHCSRSGMSRRISCVIARDGDVVDITWDVARAMGDPVKQSGKYVQDAGLQVSGCGMDMGFHVVSTLSRILFPDGFECIGEDSERHLHCPANDHANGDRDYTPHMHPNAGDYAIRQAWL